MIGLLNHRAHRAIRVVAKRSELEQVPRGTDNGTLKRIEIAGVLERPARLQDFVACRDSRRRKERLEAVYARFSIVGGGSS